MVDMEDWCSKKVDMEDWCIKMQHGDVLGNSNSFVWLVSHAGPMQATM